MGEVITDIREMVAKPRAVISQRKAQRVIDGLRERNITGVYCETCREAVRYVRELIPKGATVALGGSVTILQSGLLGELRSMKIHLLDRYREGISTDEVEEILRRGVNADVLLTSTNVITADGRLVNEDGRGNRVAGMIFGPKKVIIIAGINKIVTTLEEAVSRIKNVAAPLNCIRLGADTPCARTGFCDESECRQPHRICSQLTIIESNRVKDRLTVILVGEELGY